MLLVACPALAAEQPDAYAEGVRAFEGGDGVAALGFWTPLAEQDDPRAQFGLGLIYESGLGAAASDAEAALAWYQRAARFGFSPAQNNLALMYAEGRVVSRDLPRALTLWRQAAVPGFGPAQHNLALALERGSGVERDESEAAEWRRRADAQRLLGAKIGRPESGSGDAATGAGGDARLQREDAPVPVVRSEARSQTATSAAPRALPPADVCYLQLASFARHEAAVRWGDELSRRHPDLLAAWRPGVRSVDLGKKGVWHRVLFGPVEGCEQASALCAQIEPRVGACLVAPGPPPDGPR